jgi:hypothetical protein
VRFVLIAAVLLAGCSSASAAGSDVLTGFLRYSGGPSNSGPVKVAVYRNGHRVALQTASDAGQFRFKLSPGTYDLRANAGEAKCKLRVSVHAAAVHANLPCLGGFD